MYTLGINATFHDSSASLVKNGQLIAASEEERFTGYKHGKRPIPFSTYELPFHAIAHCLQTAGITLSEVDHIAYAFDPELLMPGQEAAATIKIPFLNNGRAENADQLWNNLFLSSVINAPDQLVDGYPHHLQQWFVGSKTDQWQWHFVDHHLAHAASAYLPSPYNDAAIMTLDGRGEIHTTTYNIGEFNDIIRHGAVAMPHSLGLLYEEITTHLGFLHSSDEYKVMALASYGKPTYLNTFREMITLGDEGQYTIDMDNFTEKFGSKRLRNEPFEAKHFNIAHSLQQALEETVLSLTDWLQQETKMQNLCIAGGVGLNCVLNSKIRDSKIFKNVWVQPAAGDSGTSLGAALWIDQQQLQHIGKSFVMDHVYWGPEYGEAEIEKFLKWAKVPYKRCEDLADETAELLADNKVVAWFQGRMEFGPRALGARSILASPISPEMQARLNDIKDREDFRPVAPVVLEEDAADWFSGGECPFMLFVQQVLPHREEQIPAVRHVDGTARVQTVNRSQNAAYYDLLKAFKRRTGVPVLVNTSFNTLGKPIVCTPRDAVACFWTSPFDALVIGPFMLLKEKRHENISSYTYFQTFQAID